jgi:hypothetical protein
MINYIIITSTVICLLILIKVYLGGIKSKPKTAWDRLNSNPEFKKMKELYEIMHEANGDGTYQDIIPEGVGEFGHDVTNPIPVNTIFGNTAYLGRLRTLDGIKVRYECRGSTRASNIKNPIDIYDIYDEEKKIAILYISPYNKKNSTLAPKGFKLVQLP